jgi:hypothetical protein
MSQDKADKPGNSMPQQKAATADPRMKSSATGGRIGRDVQQKIGQQLRAMYDDVVKEGVPDRFSEMLRQLEGSDDNSSKGSHE